MSIDELILYCIGDGRLVRLLPLFPKKGGNRRIFIAPEIVRLLEDDHGDEEAMRRCGELAGELESIADGSLVGVCMTPYEANEEATFGLLSPPNDAIWDFRSVDPSPGIRIVGAFAAKDTFIGLQWAPRSVPFLDKAPLGARDSEEWGDIITAAKAHWRRLFITWAPHRGATPDDYFSANSHPV